MTRERVHFDRRLLQSTYIKMMSILESGSIAWDVRTILTMSSPLQVPSPLLVNVDRPPPATTARTSPGSQHFVTRLDG